jgi:hypothetical protein
MRSVSVWRRLASWLALAALALQLAVSFGHVHLDGIYRAHAAAGVTGFTAKVRSHPTQQPADNDADYCAICASLYLAASSFVPQAPELPVPFVSRPVEHADRAAIVFVASQRTPFQSRAPPIG